MVTPLTLAIGYSTVALVDVATPRWLMAAAAMLLWRQVDKTWRHHRFTFTPSPVESAAIMIKTSRERDCYVNELMKHIIRWLGGGDRRHHWPLCWR